MSSSPKATAKITASPPTGETEDKSETNSGRTTLAETQDKNVAAVDDKAAATSWGTLAFEAGTLVVVGTVFGILIYKSGVARPDVMRKQFTFKSNVMLKVFLGACASSTFWFTTLRFLNRANLQICACTEVAKNTSLFAVVGGAGLLGSGMVLAAACPGTFAVQFGSGRFGVANSYLVLGGALTGAFFYTLFKPLMNRLEAWKQVDIPSVPALLKCTSPRATAAVGYATVAMLGGMLGLIEYLSPGVGELSFIGENNLWYPILCGLGIGTLQLPLALTRFKKLGSNTAYFAIVSAFAAMIPCLPARFHQKRQWPVSWKLVHITLAGGAACLLAAFLPDQRVMDFPFVATTASSTTAEYIYSFFGGFFLVFGAECAGGCTSGHGLSGAGLGCTKSFIAVAAMFAGGIATAFALNL